MVTTTSERKRPDYWSQRTEMMILRRYMQTHRFATIEQLWGLQMKERHSIVAKWPMKLKARPSDPMAQKEFDLLQASMHTGSERYVEWRRTV